MNRLMLISIIDAAMKAAETYQRLRAIAAQGGATPEQLAAMDGRLTSGIERREAELGGNPPTP